MKNDLTRPQRIALYVIVIPIMVSLAILVLAFIWFTIALLVASVGEL